MKHFTLIAIILLAVACDDCCSELSDGNDLQGKWKVVEVGYSPGAGYITEKMEDSRFIQFGSDHEFTSNYEGLEDIAYYRITESDEGVMLELFPETPKEADPDQLVYKYRMSFEDSMLKLMYAYCIEGCHIGIQKVSE